MARPNVFGLIFKIDDSDQKKFKKIGKEVTALSGKVEKELGASFLTVKNIATGLFATMATSAVANQVNEFAKLGDRIAKTSATLGLSVESLQELEYVAGQQGSSVEGLNSAYQTMSTNLGKLAVGQGKLGKFLEKSNPALLKQVKGAKNSEEAFNLLTDAISKETNESTRAALATAAFGGAAQDMIKFSKGGKENIDALREAKRRYGLISEEAAKASEAFGDAQDDLKQATQGVIASALGPLLPKLTAVIKAMTEWIANNKDFIGQKIEMVFEGIGKAVKLVSDAWDSGLLPALLAGYSAYVALNFVLGLQKSIMLAYGAATTLVGGKLTITTAAQWALNAALSANPIGLVIIAMAGLVAVSVLVYKNWDLIVQKAKELWGWLSATGDEASLFSEKTSMMSKAFRVLLAPIIELIEGIKLLGSSYDWLKSKISNEPIQMQIDEANMPGLTSANINGAYNPLQSRNQGVIQSNTTTTNRSQVDVNFKNLPSGTSVQRSSQIPGINVNTGLGMSR